MTDTLRRLNGGAGSSVGVRHLRVAPWVVEGIEALPVELGRSEDLAALVDELPEPYRSIIEAVFWEQVPRRALARRMGVARSVVERLYREALDILEANQVRDL